MRGALEEPFETAGSAYNGTTLGMFRSSCGTPEMLGFTSHVRHIPGSQSVMVVVTLPFSKSQKRPDSQQS